jgi:heavy metal-(Cd/Co/Hg/Pb/Zn)-translocating P-type ATPase
MAKQLIRRCIIYGAGVFLYCCLIEAAIHFTIPEKDKFLMFLVIYLLTGFGAFEALSEGLAQKKLQVDYLMIILATIGAFGVGRYMEGVLVMILFEMGMIFEAVSMVRAKKSIAEMIDIRPAYAVRRVQGEEERVDPSQLQFNQMIIIRPGERIPADAVVVSGKSMVDTKTVTGETVPQAIEEGDIIYGGCVNLEGVLEARVMSGYKSSAASKIMDMVEQAQNNKAGSEDFIARFSKIYTPVMLVCALIVMFVPPATFSYGNWDMWIYRGLIFLIVACPCGLVMSVPVAFLGGIVSAAKQGILVKGGNYLEALARADTFVFDKTGTLTEGMFKIEEIKAMGMTEEELLCMAAHIESNSEHPVAKSLVSAYEGRIVSAKVQNVEEIPGFGISADYEGKRVYIGNFKMMEEKEVLADEEVTDSGTVVYVGIDQWYAGCFILSDEIREDAYDTLSYLRSKCRALLIMLTGDTEDSGMDVAKELEMDYAYTSLTPAQKLEQLEDFLFLQDDTGRLVCVGDSLNDTPVLERADVGITLGTADSLAAAETAGIILMENELSKIIDAVRIARGTLRAVSQNIVFALFVKLLVLVCALVGYFGMWEAILVEVIAMFVAVLNAVWVVKYTA